MPKPAKKHDLYLILQVTCIRQTAGQMAHTGTICADKQDGWQLYKLRIKQHAECMTARLKNDSGVISQANFLATPTDKVFLLAICFKNRGDLHYIHFVLASHTAMWRSRSGNGQQRYGIASPLQDFAMTALYWHTA